MVCFVIARQPEDISRLKERFNAQTLCILRPSVESAEMSNHADAEVLNFSYDYYIINEAGLDELRKKAEDFVKEILENGTDY